MVRVNRRSLVYRTQTESALRAEQRECGKSRGEVGLEVVYSLGIHNPSALTCGSAYLNVRVCLDHGFIIAYRLNKVFTWPKKPIVPGSKHEFGYIRPRLYPFLALFRILK